MAIPWGADRLTERRASIIYIINDDSFLSNKGKFKHKHGHFISKFWIHLLIALCQGKVEVIYPLKCIIII